MSWEIDERQEQITIWAGYDAEGRRIWAITQNQNGVAVEPTGAQTYTSKAAALETHRKMQELA